MQMKISFYQSTLAFISAVMCLASSGICGDSGYVLYHASGNSYNLGPTGITGKGVAVERRVNYFIASRIDTGSPAHGLIREHDVITGANDERFPENIDARISLGKAITDSEAKDGKLHLLVTRRGKSIEVVIQLERIPDYSPTWPFNCERTDTILVNACKFLAREQLPSGEVPSDEGFIGQTQSGLFWLAMGEPLYLKNAIRAAYWFADFILESERENKGVGWGPWKCGYGALLLAEYYEMTGDKNILPALKATCGYITRGQCSSGGWSHGFDSGYGVGYGEVNNTGMICFMGLIAGKECGVEVDPAAFRLAERYYDRYAPALTSAYGDHKVSFDGYATQNGKIGGLAVAHRLNGRKVASDGYALKAARSFDSMRSGHTGHFFNVLWTTVGGSLAPAREYRKGFDQIGWYYSMARTWRGGIFCQPNPDSRSKKYAEYGQNMTTAGFGMSLAFPRRHLRILGASKSVFVVKLPPELDEARKLHQSNQWDKAIAAVDAFLKKGAHDPETVRLANELRDKSRYVKEGMALALAELDKMSSGDRLTTRAYETVNMVKPLKIILGEDDPRLKAMVDRLPGKHRLIWERGEQYYQAFAMLKLLRKELWFIYSGMVTRTFPSINMPFEEPDWVPIAKGMDDADTCRALLVPTSDDAPDGWEKASFDDSGWKGPDTQTDTGKKKRRSRPKKGYQLARVGFDVKLMPKSLRINFAKKGTGLQTGGKVYLNGELVLEAGSNIDRGDIKLHKETLELLRPGRNVLAYCSETEGGLPQLALEAELPSTAGSFAWTKVPGRDAEILKLVARREMPQAYYQADKDTRSVEELMQTFTDDHVFMPEIDAALTRYNALAPNEAERKKHISALLKSSSWGARWTGIHMIQEAMKPADGKAIRKLPQEEQDRLIAENQAGRAICDKFIDDAIKLLKDPNPLVRKEAADLVGKFGASAKAAVPSLVSMVNDFEGQTWWARDEAWKALRNMPIDEAIIQAATRAGLKDPTAAVRRTVLEKTLFAKEDNVKEKAVQTYKDELIDQIFTIPHSMFTRGSRRTAAKAAIDCLSKEDLRPYLPRFFEALPSRTHGATLDGCMMVLASFGEEVQEKIEKLTKDKNDTLRYNALQTLQKMVMADNGSPDLVKLVSTQLKAIEAADDGKRGEWANQLLQELESKNSNAQNAR